MGAKSKVEITRFYEELRQRFGWECVDSLRVFLAQLFRERELAGCTFFTSHQALCIVRYSTCPEWINKPCLTLDCTRKEDRLVLSLDVVLCHEPVYRLVTERVVCRVDMALKEFDVLYEKFLAAHER